ncbi:MAG: ATP-dependent DNA helicase, partial [Halobacteriota archaeon]
MDLFPKPRPYPNQREAMEQIAAALEESVDVVFEGACGTGKTLAALVPALEYADREDKAVVITTNVHQQMKQFVDEAREIKQIEPEVTATVFKGKRDMCHLDVGYEECQALRDNTYDLVDLERSIADKKADGVESSADVEAVEAMEAEARELRDNRCSYFHDNLVSDNEDFHRWLSTGVRRPREVFERAERDGKCGYELLKDSMDSVDLVVCNYHHLLSPEVRGHFFRWLDRPPEDVVAVFDEAHNLEDAAREHSGSKLDLETVERAELELVEHEKPGLRDALALFRETAEVAIDENLEFGEAEGPGWTDVYIDGGDVDAVTSGLPDTDEYRERIREGLEFAVKLGRRYERLYKEGETEVRRDCPSKTAFEFVDTYLALAGEPDHLAVAGARRGIEGLDRRLEVFVCLPDNVTESLFDGLHASVFMSATLRPFDVFEESLGVDNALRLAYPLEFPRDNRETYAVGLPALYSRRR